jgi:APA family basic amino acid/polyamine antiporter
VASQLFRTKSIDRLMSDSEAPERRLRKTLGVWSLTALGIGAVIGTGIFVLTGTAAAGEQVQYPSLLKAPLLQVLLHGSDAVGTAGRPGAGPAISLSFFLVAVVCALAALCYAELAAMIPIAGSAYTYTYATMGELVAWIIGWDLILEYAVSNMAVGVGFSAYITSLFSSFGIDLPANLTSPAYSPASGWAANFNLPGFLIVMFVTALLLLGIRESAGANSIMVGIKVAAILIFIFAAAEYVNPTNWRPFMPNGWQGVLTGGAIVFFSYIGFDSVSTAAEECRNPKRDLPLGIIFTLLVCSILYVSVAVVLTGMQHYSIFMGEAAPVAKALRAVGLDRIQRVVTIGALTGMVSSLLVYQYGQTRIWYAMSRDGLLPAIFSRVHPRIRVPHVSTWVAGIVVGIPAGLLDIGTLADLSSIGTLFAFVLVSIAVLVLRRTQPDRPRGFRVPMVKVVAPLSVVSCLFLMLGLPLENWLRLAVWLVIGLVIYFAYGRKHSGLRGEPTGASANR